MRDTLTVQVDIDAAYAALEKLKDEQRRAPTARKYAIFQRNSRGRWFGPYWEDAHDRSCSVHTLVIGYSWTTVMIFGTDEDDIVHLVSDMKTPIPERDELVKVCKDLIASPQHQQ